MLTQVNTFGEPAEVILSSEQADGHLCIIRQTVHLGGGPPPMHTEEDEVFSVVSG